MATTRSHTTTASLTAAVATFFTDAKASWTAARKRRSIYNRTYRELASLSDMELSDINISRGEIPRIAKEAANGL